MIMDNRLTKLKLSYHECYVVYKALEDAMYASTHNIDYDADFMTEAQKLLRKISSAVRDNPEDNEEAAS